MLNFFAADPVSDLIAAFNRVLDDIVAGTITSVPDDTGIDPETVEILELLAAQPEKTTADIAACRSEFGRQLDGTHDAELLA
jgi:hypothetical protein